MSLTFKAGNSLTYLLITSKGSDLFATTESTLYSYNYETDLSSLESKVVPRIKAIIRQSFTNIADEK